MKYIVTMVFALLFLTASSQQTIVYSNIKVGETIPDLELTNIDNFLKSNIKLSELKQQLLIIDFWATWCGPCIAKIPRMDSIMKALPDDMLFLSVSDEPREKVRNFLKKKEKDMGTKLVIPSITEDVELAKLFPHYFVPHYVWIKLPERKVIAITKGEEIRFDKVNAVLQNPSNAQVLTTKVDKVLDYEISDPLFQYLAQNDSIRRHSFKQYSFFTNHIPNLNGGVYSTNMNGDTTEIVRYLMKNMSIQAMAARAFGEGHDFLQDSSIAIEVKEPEKVFTNLNGDPFREWRKKNTYCYEVQVDKKNKYRLNDIIRNDITNYFPQYEFKVERRPKDSWVLISIGSNESLKSKGGKTWSKKSGNTVTLTNSNINGLIMSFRYPYFLYSNILLADRTNIDYNIDLEISPKSFTDIEEANKELKRYNLKFERRVELVDILVIKDK